MVVDKIAAIGKSTFETLRGAVVVAASPNAPIPPTKLHPRMPPRPFTGPEWFRMLSWRYLWQYNPVIRYYIYSTVIVLGVFKFLVPIKPRHKIMYHKSKEDSHHHEIHEWAGFRQKKQDKEYFRKYDPFRKAGAEVPTGH